MNKREIKEQLLVSGEQQKNLFEVARRKRKESFGEMAYVRAIIEPSNYCRNSCLYCAMRKENKSLRRYRMRADKVIATADQMAEQGVQIFSLETGEDPESITDIVHVAEQMKEKGYWILGAFGDLEKDDYQRLRDAGIDAYLLKFESSNPELFSRFRPRTTLQRRLNDLEYLQKLEFKIATGSIVGFPGQTLDDVAEDIILTASFQPFTATISPLIPSPTTPLQNEQAGDVNLALNAIAVYRQLLPESHIPALCALNFFPHRSQLDALNAGANDILINTSRRGSLAYNFALYSTNKQCITLGDAQDIVKRARLRIRGYFR